MTNTTYSTHVLEQIKGDFISGIEQFIINDLESYGDDWYLHLQDIIDHGCISGTVASMIYYSDTNNFHDEYENEIDEIIETYLDDMGEKFSDLATTFNFDGWDISQLKNWKAWFAYECVASNINRALEDGEYEDLEEDVASFLDDMIMTSGFEYEEHKNIAITIFEGAGQLSEEEFSEKLNDESINFIHDVNLCEVVKHFLESGFTMNDIGSSWNISFYFCDDNGFYGAEIQ